MNNSRRKGEDEDDDDDDDDIQTGYKHMVMNESYPI